MMNNSNNIGFIEYEKKIKEKRRNNKRKVVRLRDRSLTRFEVINLFEDVFDSEEREVVSTILKILAIYMLLETNQLFQIYERMTKDKMKLKFIKKAVFYNLIGEFKYESTVDGEKALFFYSTKLSGRIFLNNIRYNHNELPLDANIELRQRILTLNEFIIHERYFMKKNKIVHHGMGLYEAFDDSQNTLLCYFSEISTGAEVIRYMIRFLERFNGPDDPPITKADVLDKYTLVPIRTVGNVYFFGDLTIATPYIFYSRMEE